MEKTCVICKLEKNIEFFSKSISKRDGHNDYCKSCHSIYRKKQYRLNKDKERAQVDLYQQTHPVKVESKYNRFCKKAGRSISSRCSICSSEIFVTKKDSQSKTSLFCSRECRRRTFQSAYCRYLVDVKRRATKIGKEFSIDESFVKYLLEVKQDNRCKVTNIPIIIKHPKDGKFNICDSASLDRIDNTKGYTKDNVQWVALGVNYMKNDGTQADLEKLITLIRSN